MESMRAFVVIGALLTVFSPTRGTIVETRTINTSFVAEQATGQPKIGSSPSFLCIVKETSFFRSGNDISFYKRQASDAAWVNITRGGSPSARYRLSLLNQESSTEVGHRLTIENFQAADVGVYRCTVTPVNPKDIVGTTSAEVSVSVAPQRATVNMTTSAEESQPGIYRYEAHHTTTTCTVDVISLTDVEVKVLYNGTDYTREFSATPTFSWEGSVDSVKEPRRRIILVSQTFKPVSRTQHPVVCVAIDQQGNELGRASIDGALKSLPRIECIQSGQPPAYLDDSEVIITCELHDYDWNPKSSRFSWSFTSNDGGDLTTVTLDDTKVGKHGRRIVEDPESGKHSLLISKITSDAARFTVYNIALKENDDTVTTTTFTLQVLNRSRSSEFISNATRPVIADALVLFLSLVAVLAV